MVGPIAGLQLEASNPASARRTLARIVRGTRAALYRSDGVIRFGVSFSLAENQFLKCALYSSFSNEPILSQLSRVTADTYI